MLYIIEIEIKKKKWVKHIFHVYKIKLLTSFFLKKINKKWF